MVVYDVYGEGVCVGWIGWGVQVPWVGEGEGTGGPVWESVRKLGKKYEASMIMHVLQR